MKKYNAILSLHGHHSCSLSSPPLCLFLIETKERSILHCPLTKEMYLKDFLFPPAFDSNFRLLFCLHFHRPSCFPLTIHTPIRLSMKHLSNLLRLHETKETLACRAAFPTCGCGRVTTVTTVFVARPLEEGAVNDMYVSGFNQS